MLKKPGLVADAARADEFSYVADETLLSFATGMSVAKARKLLKGRSLPELLDDPEHSAKLRACVALARRVHSPRPPERGVFQSSRDVAKAYSWLTEEAEEQVWAAYLNQRHQMLFEERICRGGPATASVDIRAVLTRALKVGAVAVIMIHNHPVDATEPSREDIELTAAIVKGCNAVDCHLLDHVIVAKSGSYSFLDAGLLKVQ